MALTLSKTNHSEGGPYRFSLEEFFRLLEWDFFGEQRVELLNGEIFVMPRQGPPHAQSVRRLNKALTLALSEQAVVSPQLPVVLIAPPPDYVEPDLSLLKLPETQYAGRDVTSEDLLLAIEISDSTLKRDQGEKLEAYARNRVAEVWIHNLINGKLEVYRQPDGTEYRSKQVLEVGQGVAPEAFPKAIIAWWPETDAS